MKAPHARPDEPGPAEAAPRRSRTTGWVALAVFLYGTCYLIWYLGTPLGRAPQLDGRENLELAAQIAQGTLAHEPFYRAMLYPAVLAVPLMAGCPPDWLPMLAALAGLLMHFAATWAVALLARRVWQEQGGDGAAAIAAALWGLNPVALFYAVDVLDVTLALALFLWGLVWLSNTKGRAREKLGGGILLGLAVAVRPHFLPVVLAAPLAAAWLAGRWKPETRDAMAWAGAALPLLLVGAVQWGWAGELRIMPWQGAYNLYSANRPGANGKYYAQRMFFADIAPGENPTRKESELIFGQETGSVPPYKVGAMEGYWQARALQSIMRNPLAWAELMGRKTYYLLNDFDQYNNKTYAWHQQQSPWLRWNYLSWGGLLMLAAGSLALAWMTETGERRTRIMGVLLVFCAYGAGVVLYYASGRFRLPLAPLLAVLAGGWACCRPQAGRPLRPAGALARGIAVLAMVLAGVAAFSDFFAARDEATFIQDELLSANAAADVGEDAQAYALAKAVLARDAQRPDARRIALVSWFNLAVAGKDGADAAEQWRQQLPLLKGLELRDPVLAFVAGVAWWKTGDSQQAETIWKEGAARFGANSAPGRAVVAAEYAQHAAMRGGTPPPETGLVEYLTQAN